MTKLLLVDDEPVLLSALSRILADAGYEVTAASSGTQAMSALSDPGGSLPDLILTDVLMEDGDGLQLFAFVNQNPSMQHIPFIFVSASAKPELEALIAGSSRATFVRKPFEVNALLDKVAQILERSTGHD